jgi:hypothetical protein
MVFANKCGVEIRGEAVPPKRAKRLGSRLNQIAGFGRKVSLAKTAQDVRSPLESRCGAG